MPRTTQQNFLASDAQVASIAREYVQNATGADQARGTYLKILVAHALRELSKSTHKRYSAAESLAAVETVHAHLYAVVTEAVTTPDVAAPLANEEVDADERRRRTQERNRRTNFARSSKSDLANFIKAGGRLVTLTPESVTREFLRQTVRAARAGPRSVPERFNAQAEQLENTFRQLLEQDAETARAAFDELQHRLQVILTPPKPMTGTRRVKDLTLHAEH